MKIFYFEIEHYKKDTLYQVAYFLSKDDIPKYLMYQSKNIWIEDNGVT